jgi:lysophospholipase L1-like esterase
MKPFRIALFAAVIGAGLYFYIVNRSSTGTARGTSPRANPSMQANTIALFGDSHFEFFPTRELLKGYDIVNLGISGETSNDLLERVEPLVREPHALVIVCIGANDVGMGRKPEDYKRDLTQLVQQLRSGVNAERLLLLAIPPHAHPAQQASIERFNAIGKAVADAHHIRFADLSPTLMENGVLSDALTADGLHLNRAGYARWAAALKEFLPG